MRLLAFAWVLVFAILITCDSSDDGEDDDNDTVDDDDDDNDNDASDDDSVVIDLDAVLDYRHSCVGVATGLVETCELTFLDDDYDVPYFTDWCELSLHLLFGLGGVSPFWDCLGDCALLESCDEDCTGACLDPPSPGSGCGVTVDAIYACNIVWVFEGDEFWIPEMDMQIACEFLTEWAWDCYADCIPGGCDDMLECLIACDA
jgi:hypothetical protein